MISLHDCARLAGLSPSEVLFGVVPSLRHDVLFTSYEANMHHSVTAVCDMIIADLHTWLDLGSPENAADTLLVLSMFLAKYPQVLSNVSLGHI